MVSEVPFFLQRSASAMAVAMPCVASGAGMMPSAFAKVTPASNTSKLSWALASISWSFSSWLTITPAPWYLKPPAWMGAGTKSCPHVYMGSKGVIPAVSPKS